jgi:hypothetical protein
VGYLALRELPFSSQQATNVKGSGFLRGALIDDPAMDIRRCTLFCLPVYNSDHYPLHTFRIASWLMMDALKNKGWEKLQVNTRTDCR